MALYVIGDIQGCYDALMRLLDRLAFDPQHDEAWIVGDLVNRGPQSLEVLRWVRAHDRIRCVLGNHDLHLLAVGCGRHVLKSKDTLEPILSAPDADELLDWVRHRPLAHYDADRGLLMVHAGVPPGWTLATLLDEAAAVGRMLSGPNWVQLMDGMYGNEPDRWSERLAGLDRLRFTINALTRIRYCTADGRLDFDEKGPPGSQPAGLLPWFEHPDARWAPARVVFGHWSALGARVAPDWISLDSGCVWGRALTAVAVDRGDRLEAVACA